MLTDIESHLLQLTQELIASIDAGLDINVTIIYLHL
jgi:hypothetical protein